MATLELRRLRLRADLPHVAVAVPASPVPEGGEDGEELLLAWDEAGLVADDAGEGPRIRRPLRPPARAWASPVPDGTALRSPGPVLAAGEWLIAQGDPSGDVAGFLEGFLREAWWEGERASGPLFLRWIHEDGRWTAQAWRRPAP